MNKNLISHSREKESKEAKARWFQRLPLKDRMDLLCFYTDLIVENNPDVLKNKNAQSTRGRIRIVTKKRG